jgi:hypothetical protein
LPYIYLPDVASFCTGVCRSSVFSIVDTNQIVGSIVLLIMGIVFHLLQEDNPLAMLSILYPLLKSILTFGRKHPVAVLSVALGAVGMAGLGQNAHRFWLVHLGFGVTYLILLVPLIWGISRLLRWKPKDVDDERAPVVAVIILCCVFIVIVIPFHWDKVASLRSENAKSGSAQSVRAFGIEQGVPIISRDINQILYWVKFNGVDTITPIHVMVPYTVTNLKPTPVMISRLSLEIQGPHETWWKLNNLPTEQPIWAADIMKNPREVSSITLEEGFLEDHVRNVELEPGKTVRGWMLFQYPVDFPRIKTMSTQPIRLTITDTAGDKEVQALDFTSTNSNVLSSGFRFEPVPNVDLTNYKIVTYGPE